MAASTAPAIARSDLATGARDGKVPKDSYGRPAPGATVPRVTSGCLALGRSTAAGIAVDARLLGFVGGAYRWHGGYWGPHVGFYGGINYGYGYGGAGFYGGRWKGGVFRYNTAVMRVGPGFHGVYEDGTVIRNTTVVNRASFNGEGGIVARPTAEERTAMNEPRVQRTSEQISHQRASSQDRNYWASEHHGNPSHPEGMGVPMRQERQQQRIGNGVKSGQLTPRETSHIEHNEININREARNDRAANGGKLTPGEQRQVEHQQNRESRQIYEEKHNARTDAHPKGEERK